MPKREDMGSSVERSFVFLSALETIAEKKDTVKALNTMTEWSKMAYGKNRYAAGIYYINYFVLPSMNGADMTKRQLPRWVDEALFHPVLEPTNIPEFLSLFKSNYVDCFSVRKDSPMDQKVYDNADMILEDQWMSIVEDNKNRHRESFFCPLRIEGSVVNEKSNSRRLDENVKTFSVCFGDLDGGDKVSQDLMIAMNLEPSMIVESSNGYHVYYFLDEDVEKEEWVNIQKGIIEALGADKAIKNPSRLLRLPFTYHCKSDPYFVTIKQFKFKRYSKNDLMAAFPYSEKKPKQFYIPDEVERTRDLKTPIPTIITEGDRHGALLEEAGRVYAKLQQDRAYDARCLLKSWYNRSSSPLKPGWEKEVDDVVDFVERREYGTIVSR